MTANLLRAGQKYTLVTRITRRTTSSGGIVVPRRSQEETFGAIVYDPGIEGAREGIEEGDLLLVRPHCGHDFTLNDPHLGKVYLTALDINNDEIFGTLSGKGDLDKRAY